MSGQKDNGGGGLSVETLLIASLSSLAAAYFIHTFWEGGAILGAAVTPVIVALVSESLRKPAQVVKARTGRTTEVTAIEPPPVVTEREDKFGIWEDQKQARPRRRLHWGLAIATGLAAFALAAFVLTGAELVFGGASDGDKFRVIPGSQQKKDSGGSDSSGKQPQETTPDEEQPAPEEQAPQTAPPETTPPEEAPEQQTVPEEQAPVPDPGGETVPVP